MSHLSLVKNLARVQEEQKHSQTYFELGNLRLLRGSVTEFTGETTSGKTSLAFMLLSSLTQNGEICSVVDLGNSFNPVSASASGMVLENLLWIRCGGNIENAFKAIDNLIQANNFGSIWLDLSDRPAADLNHIPTSYWYRFRTRILGSQTLLIVTAKQSLTGSASSQSYEYEKEGITWSGAGKFKLIAGLQVSLNTRKPFLIKPEYIKIEARYLV
jgi:hypothetical protein